MDRRSIEILGRLAYVRLAELASLEDTLREDGDDPTNRLLLDELEALRVYAPAAERLAAVLSQVPEAPARGPALEPPWELYSERGLEGVFSTHNKAVAYAVQIRGIGAQKLRVRRSRTGPFEELKLT